LKRASEVLNLQTSFVSRTKIIGRTSPKPAGSTTLFQDLHQGSAV
jgi:hypothetical protein